MKLEHQDGKGSKMECDESVLAKNRTQETQTRNAHEAHGWGLPSFASPARLFSAPFLPF